MKKRALIFSIITAILLFSLNPVFAEEGFVPKAEFIIQPDEWHIIDGVDNSVPIYSDNSNARLVIDDEDFYGLEGATLIQTRLADSTDYLNKPGYNVNSDQIQSTVKVNHSCEIYVFSTSKSGMTANGLDYLRWLGRPAFGFEPILDESGEYKTIMIKNYGGNPRAHYIYKKTITVPEGETATFDLGYIGKWCQNFMYSVVIVWSGDNE